MGSKFSEIGFVALIQAKKARSLARRAVAKVSGRYRDTGQAELPRQVPKAVWIYWDSGEADAPPMVKASIASWRRQNPGWEVVVLDRDSASRAVEMPMGPGDIQVQAYADLLRLRLLRQKGGVWADATLFCVKPLDHWLPPLTRHGFFMFVWTEADRWFILPNVLRVVTNWFLASEPQGEVISVWEGESFAYWRGRKTAHIYYWPHVLFEYLVLTNARLRRGWKAMPKLGAYGPHLVHAHVASGGDPVPVRAALESGAAPVQKLRWNWTPEQEARAREVLPELDLPMR